MSKNPNGHPLNCECPDCDKYGAPWRRAAGVMSLSASEGEITITRERYLQYQAAEARVKALTQTMRRVREFVELEADNRDGAGALETDYADEARETLAEIDDVLLQGEGSK